MMVDVVLVNGPWEEGFNRCGRWGGRSLSLSRNPPLYFLYSASVLENHGHSVKVVDALAEGLSLEQTKRRIEYYDPRMVVIETNCASVYADLECAKAVKDSGVELVGLSGLMATVEHKWLMSFPYIDFCILGEYDFTITKLFEQKHWKHIDGVSYRNKNGVWVNPKKHYIENMDSLPYPAYHLVDCDLYDELIIQHRPFVQSIESRGCPFNCIMCTSHLLYGCKWRFMSAKRIVDEMEYWQHQGIKQTFWDGETLTVSKKRVFEVCKLIKERDLKIRWSCLSRADTVSPLMLKEMAEANCVYIRYGFESGNQMVLDFIQKGYKVKDIVNASKWTRDAGIRIHGAWMFVPPIEKEHSIKQTVDLAKKTCDTAQFTICTPYAGTQYYDLCHKNGYLLTTDWKEYLASDKSVVASNLDLSKMVRDAYKSFYLRPSCLYNNFLNELKKGTLKNSMDVALKIIGVKKYW